MSTAQTEVTTVPEGIEVAMEGFLADMLKGLTGAFTKRPKPDDRGVTDPDRLSLERDARELLDKIKETYGSKTWLAKQKLREGSETLSNVGVLYFLSNASGKMSTPAEIRGFLSKVESLFKKLAPMVRNATAGTDREMDRLLDIPRSSEGKQNLWNSVNSGLSDRYKKLDSVGENEYQIKGPGQVEIKIPEHSFGFSRGTWDLKWEMRSVGNQDLPVLDEKGIHEAAGAMVDIVKTILELQDWFGNMQFSYMLFGKNIQIHTGQNEYGLYEIYSAEVSDPKEGVLRNLFFQRSNQNFLPEMAARTYIDILSNQAVALERWIRRSIRDESKKGEIATEALVEVAPAVALEDVENGKIFVEHEHEIYVRIDDLEQLTKAESVDHQEQWTVKVAKSDKNGARGNIRIRKIVKRNGYGGELGQDAQYVYNIKANMADGARLEVPLPATEDSFKVFKALAESGMIKDRYHFPHKESGLVFEVDMFLDPEGNYYPWAKIDIEVKDINAEIPELPIVVAEKIMGDSKDKADKDRITELYDQYFLTPNPYVKKDAKASEA